MKTKHKVHVITMGCAKNVVDSEKLMAQLRSSDVELTPSIEGADIAVINTCGFIDPAKEESIDMIIDNVKLKTQGKLKKVYAMGCLSERYRADLAKEIPEVDGFFGSHQMQDVLEELGAKYKYELLGERTLTTPAHFAYLKISEGCDNPCSFCAIPIMRGKHVSRSVGEILSEARLLAAKGVKELVVIGQDTTYYGLDSQGRRSLAELLDRLGDVHGIEWVRLMYAYPARFPKDVLRVIARHPKVCKYLDMPVQHVADEVLKSMRRGISLRALRDLIDAIRDQVPDIALRTTLIVGYPNETEKEFNDLLNFVGDTEFDRAGVFVYSREDGTTAYSLGDPVSHDEKQKRREMIMHVQQGVSKRKNEMLIGTRQKVLVDRAEEGLFIGRTERDAPEIDNEVHIRSRGQMQVGGFYDVDIAGASAYDLYGTL